MVKKINLLTDICLLFAIVIMFYALHNLKCEQLMIPVLAILMSSNIIFPIPKTTFDDVSIEVSSWKLAKLSFIIKKINILLFEVVSCLFLILVFYAIIYMDHVTLTISYRNIISNILKLENIIMLVFTAYTFSTLLKNMTCSYFDLKYIEKFVYSNFHKTDQ